MEDMLTGKDPQPASFAIFFHLSKPSVYSTFSKFGKTERRLSVRWQQTLISFGPQWTFVWNQINVTQRTSWPSLGFFNG